MPKIFSINLGNFGSTGRIVRGIGDSARLRGFETYFAYPEHSLNLPKNDNDICISSDITRRINAKLSFYTGYIGCFSWISTLRLIRKIKKIHPDIIHLHKILKQQHQLLF
mgnify:FL=1